MVARVGAADGHETSREILSDLRMAIAVHYLHPYIRLYVNCSGNDLLPALDAPEGWTQYHPADRGSHPGEAPSFLGPLPLDTEDFGMLPRAQVSTRIA